MDLLVLPHMGDENQRARTLDELPQSSSGKTIMTTEPKFIPKEAAEIVLSDDVRVKVRLIDCVGYMTEGAKGHIEDGEERKVKTPWFDYEIPFTKAAGIGTRKVIHDHATIGIVVTTDGTIGEIPREAYREPEGKTIRELKELVSRFLFLLIPQDRTETRQPDSQGDSGGVSGSGDAGQLRAVKRRRHSPNDGGDSL